jgi:hypothetical protein
MDPGAETDEYVPRLTAIVVFFGRSQRPRSLSKRRDWLSTSGDILTTALQDLHILDSVTLSSR